MMQLGVGDTGGEMEQISETQQDSSSCISYSGYHVHLETSRVTPTYLNAFFNAQSMTRVRSN